MGKQGRNNHGKKRVKLIIWFWLGMEGRSSFDDLLCYMDRKRDSSLVSVGLGKERCTQRKVGFGSPPLLIFYFTHLNSILSFCFAEQIVGWQEKMFSFVL